MPKGIEILQVGEHVVLCLVGFHMLRLLRRNGPMGVAKEITTWIRAIPGVDAALTLILAHEAKGAVRLLTASKKKGENQQEKEEKKVRVTIPLEGVSEDDIIRQLEAKQGGEKQMLAEGRVFALVYTPNDQKHGALLNAAHGLFSSLPPASLASPSPSPQQQQQHHEAFLRSVYSLFAHGNALNPTAFPSLLEMENDVVAMTAAMLNGDAEVAGSMTSGGTESILMAMKTYRDRARALAPHIKHPEVIAPITIHPAFEKAAHYFDLTMVHIPLDQDLKPDLAKYKAAINRNTILLLASAPQYCHGVVDPIEAISDLALAHGLPLHVDACFGGFMLPWVEKLGYPVPLFDFRVPGVTSISADLHKYGYVNKGSSVILYRNVEIRKYQYFAYSSWPGGLFGSPSMAGTRPGGNIAMAWSSLMVLGQNGFMRIAKELLDITEKMKEAVNSTPGLKVLGQPHMTCFAFGSTDPTLEVLAIADVMEEKGWKIERQQNPRCLHCSILPHHVHSVGQFAGDLAAATAHVRENKQLAKKGAAAMYGQVAMIPDSAIVDDFILNFFSEIYTPK